MGMMLQQVAYQIADYVTGDLGEAAKLAPAGLAAITAIGEGEPDREITLPDGRKLGAIAVVDELVLDAFID